VDRGVPVPHPARMPLVARIYTRISSAGRSQSIVSSPVTSEEMDAVMRLTSPLPLAEVRRRIRTATSEPLVPAGDLPSVQPSGWISRRAAQPHMAADRSVHARVGADDLVLLKERAGLWQWSLGDTCRVQLRPPPVGDAGPRPEPAGTLLICEWIVSPARVVFMALVGVVWAIFGVALAIGIFFDRHAGIAAKIFLVLFGCLNAMVGFLALWGAPRPQVRGRRDLLAWLKQTTSVTGE